MSKSKIKRALAPSSVQQPLNSSQVKNSAGGYVSEIDKWEALNRFVMIGTLGGTYYISERDLTQENVDKVIECVKENATRVVDQLLDISTNGRAPKQTYTFYTAALVAKHGDLEGRQHLYKNLHNLCRTGSHLFEFIDNLKAVDKGWGRGIRNAVARWYTMKSPSQVEYQAVKYRNRNGYSHGDALRLSHPVSENHNELFAWILGNESNTSTLELVTAYERMKSADNKVEAAIQELIKNPSIPREALPTEVLNSREVWQLMLPDMPLTALLRNLGKMTTTSLFDEVSNIDIVVGKITNTERLNRARVHPLTVWEAMKTYTNGRGVKGGLSWTPVPRISRALDEAFYASFDNIEPSNKVGMIAIDCSGSMSADNCIEKAVVMAMAQARSNPNSRVFRFTYQKDISELDVSGRRLDDILRSVRAYGGTDCSLPFVKACEDPKFDNITIYTDNETWSGPHPKQLWDEYKNSVPHAKAVLVALTANNFTLFSHNLGRYTNLGDDNTLSVVGFDSSLPSVINAFLNEV